MEEGKVLGHENMGVVEAIGSAVSQYKVGDRVSVPFNIACGFCTNCVTGWTSFCTRMNPTEGVDGAAYGDANMGPYDGGQAELSRAPEGRRRLTGAGHGSLEGSWPLAKSQRLPTESGGPSAARERSTRPSSLKRTLSNADLALFDLSEG